MMNRAGRRRVEKWSRKVQIVGRGGFVRVRLPGQPGKAGGGRRGEVTGFSNKARFRLLEYVAGIAEEDFRLAKWITLTYVRNMQDPVRSERDLEALFGRIARRYPGTIIIWGRQRQKRGAIHYHFMLLGCHWIPKTWLAEAWGDITGDQRPFTRVEALRSRKRAMCYCAKYMVKQEESPPGDAGGGAAQAASRPASGPLGSTDVPYSCGRSWGAKGRKYLSEQIEVIGHGKVTPEALRRLRSAGREKWKGVGDIGGFGLFVEDGCLQAEEFCAIVGLCPEVSGRGDDLEAYERYKEELWVGGCVDRVA